MPDNWGVIHLAELAARASEHGTPGAVWSLAMSDLNLVGRKPPLFTAPNKT